MTPIVGTASCPGLGFGTDGIRGVAGEQLTPLLALQVGYWAGRVLDPPGPVLLGMDSRSSGPMLAAALSAGLTAAGREVWDLGLCPTPAVARLVALTGATAGLMISASHNPPADNGIKLFGNGGTKLTAIQRQGIEAGLAGAWEQTFTAAADVHRRSDLLRRYVTALKQSLQCPDLSGLRVVLDLCWGAATVCTEELFRSLGAEVIVLHGRPDGRRINVDCGSTAMAPLATAVLAHGADCGFAFDGDADRVLAVDERGRPVDGDHILFLWGSALAAADLLPERRLVATIMSNLGFERAWRADGGTLLRTPVGDQHVQAEMARTGTVLGGEQSGHILCAHHGSVGDGLMTALQLARILCAADSSFSSLVDAAFVAYPQKLTNVPVPDRNLRSNWRACKPLRQALERAEQAMADQGRVLVRPSGTEPLLRVMIEATDQATVDHWSETLAAMAAHHLVPAAVSG